MFKSITTSQRQIRSRYFSSLIDYEQYISVVSAKRKPSAIRALMPLLKQPGMISLGGGLPNPDSFPLKKICVVLEGGESFEIAGSKLTEALQYSSTTGLPSLLSQLDELRRTFHKPEHTGAPQDHRVSLVGTGSQVISMCQCFKNLLSVLVQSYSR